MEIYKTPIGVLVMEGDRLVDKRLFPKDPKRIAEKMLVECKEEDELKKKYPRLEQGARRLPLGDLAERAGFCKKSEFPAVLSKVNEEMARLGVKTGFGRDKLVANAVRAQRALEENTNNQSETLREWYSIHFPELNGVLKDNRDYAKVVSGIGARSGMTESALEKVLTDRRYAKAIPQIAAGSMGSDVSETDLKAIRVYAESVLASAAAELNLKSYIERVMSEIAPNTSAVATPYVGALLLEQAGSLERLAAFPSSTIQVLGAQKAMFRFLKTGKLPPKYGVLYVHPLVSQASKKAKGKIARTLASKISIAVKVDFYGGKPIGERLKKESEERAKSLK